jgi:hypothetical protein
MRQIPEKDWKVLRKLKDGLLQRYCSEALVRLKPIIFDPGPDSHKAYLQLWKLLRKEDKELSLLFDELKRSTAFFKLAAWRSRGLLSDEDFNQFSAETMEAIDLINSA